MLFHSGDENGLCIIQNSKHIPYNLPITLCMLFIIFVFLARKMSSLCSSLM